jgi:hypothetical protein
LIALIAVVVFVAMVGGRYYKCVTNTQTPFDEVGINLNAPMPGSIRDWGYGRLNKLSRPKRRRRTAARDQTGNGRDDAPTFSFLLYGKGAA